MEKGVATMYVSEFANGTKEPWIETDKKDLGNDGIAFLGLYSEGEDELPFSVVFDEARDRVPITKSLMKESEMEKT